MLADELASHRHANSAAGADELIFPTSAGTRRDKDNAREGVIRPVVRRADELLEGRRQQPLPEGVTPRVYAHAMRRDEDAKERLKARSSDLAGAHRVSALRPRGSTGCRMPENLQGLKDRLESRD